MIVFASPRNGIDEGSGLKGSEDRALCCLGQLQASGLPPLAMTNFPLRVVGYVSVEDLRLVLFVVKALEAGLLAKGAASQIVVRSGLAQAVT